MRIRIASSILLIGVVGLLLTACAPPSNEAVPVSSSAAPSAPSMKAADGELPADWPGKSPAVTRACSVMSGIESTLAYAKDGLAKGKLTAEQYGLVVNSTVPQLFVANTWGKGGGDVEDAVGDITLEIGAVPPPLSTKPAYDPTSQKFQQLESRIFKDCNDNGTAISMFAPGG